MAVDPATVSKMTPVWKIGRIDIDHNQWGHVGIDRHIFLDDIFPKLKNYESMTWGEITRDPRRNHSVPVENLIKQARDRLQELHVDEEELFRLRLSGTQRVWGIRDRDTFYILWWDPEHKICPSRKKHT